MRRAAARRRQAAATLGVGFAWAAVIVNSHTGGPFGAFVLAAVVRVSHQLLNYYNSNGGYGLGNNPLSQPRCSPTHLGASRVLQQRRVQSTDRATMCWVSKAISPPYAWAATKLGEWYWNELPHHAGPWHLEPDDDDDDDNLATFRDFAHRTKEETAKAQEDCGGPVSGAPHRQRGPSR